MASDQKNGARLVSVRVDDIALASVRGLVDARGMAGVLQANEATRCALDVGAQVVRYDEADMSLTVEDLHQAMLTHQRGGGGIVRIPTALLVRASAMGYWMQYAWLMAGAGVLRRPFVALAPALAWARTEGMLAEAQRIRAPRWVPAH